MPHAHTFCFEARSTQGFATTASSAYDMGRPSLAKLSAARRADHRLVQLEAHSTQRTSARGPGRAQAATAHMTKQHGPGRRPNTHACAHVHRRKAPTLARHRTKQHRQSDIQRDGRSAEQRVAGPSRRRRIGRKHQDAHVNRDPRTSTRPTAHCGRNRPAIMSGERGATSAV